MTSEERKSIENGIWMCGVHAKLIDSDEITYTVAGLIQMREDAEARAERILRTGSADPTEPEATESLVSSREGTARIDSSLGFTNVGHGRFVRILDSESGQVLGQGIRWSVSEVLTVGGLIASGDEVVVEGVEAGQISKLGKARIKERSGAGAPDESPVHLHLETFERFFASPALASEAPARGTRWRSLALGPGSSGADRVFLEGEIVACEGEDGPWLLNVEDGSPEARAPGAVEWLRGAGVWIAGGGLGWQLLGALARRHRNESSETWQAMDLRELCRKGGGERTRKWRGVLKQIVRSLKNAETRELLLEDRAEDVSGSEESLRTFAEQLCFQTPPTALARLFLGALRRCRDVGPRWQARSLWKLLLAALPISLDRELDQALPDPLAAAVKLRPGSRPLVEPILSAAGGRPAEYRETTTQPGSVFFPGVFEISNLFRGGETWGELDSQENLDLASDITKVLQDVPGLSGTERDEMLRILGRLAATQNLGSQNRLLDRQHFDGIREGQGSQADHAREILEWIDRALARRARDGQGIYTIQAHYQDHQREEAEEFFQRLASLATELQIVSLERLSSAENREWWELSQTLADLFALYQSLVSEDTSSPPAERKT